MVRQMLNDLDVVKGSLKIALQTASKGLQERHERKRKKEQEVKRKRQRKET